MYGSIAFSLLTAAAGAAAAGVSVTPHDSYSSSVGVLGCKVDTNRIAYWPESVSCDKICVKLSYQGRSVHLLRVDQSGGAHDISYDAWNYLQTGKSATADPISGGGVSVEYEDVDASECADLIKTDGNKLPLSASNSIDFVASCLAQPDSFVAKNHVLYNIVDAICSWGYDETCSLDLATSNQPSCPHTLGLTTPLEGADVYNIEYPSGQTVVASTGKVVAARIKVEKDAADAADNSVVEESSQTTGTTTGTTTATVIATVSATKNKNSTGTTFVAVPAVTATGGSASTTPALVDHSVANSGSSITGASAALALIAGLVVAFL